MSIAHAMLAEFEHESKTTRKFLEADSAGQADVEAARKIPYRRRFGPAHCRRPGQCCEARAGGRIPRA